MLRKNEEEKNQNAKQRIISGRVTPGIVCAAWIDKIEMSSTGICKEAQKQQLTEGRKWEGKKSKMRF